MASLPWLGSTRPAGGPIVIVGVCWLSRPRYFGNDWACYVDAEFPLATANIIRGRSSSPQRPALTAGFFWFNLARLVITANEPYFVVANVCYLRLNVLLSLLSKH
jgi:hypothetical protein